MAEAEVLHVYLTPVRRRLLGEIQLWHDIYGYAPSVRELQEILGYASTSTVHGHLHQLRRRGTVDWVEGQNRTLHLTPLGRAAVYG